MCTTTTIRSRLDEWDDLDDTSHALFLVLVIEVLISSLNEILTLLFNCSLATRLLLLPCVGREVLGSVEKASASLIRTTTIRPRLDERDDLG